MMSYKIFAFEANSFSKFDGCGNIGHGRICAGDVFEKLAGVINFLLRPMTHETERDTHRFVFP
jgi:hypothetical protein